MTSSLIALFIAAAAQQELPATIAAETPLPWGTEMAALHGPLGRHAVGTIGIYGRVSFLSSTEVTADGVTWDQLFNEGWGFSVEADISAVIDKNYTLGGYISVGWDGFNGQTDTDDFGDSITPKRMEMVTALVGVKSTGYFDEIFYWEGRMGVGLVHYRQVLADFTIGGVTFTDQEFFKDSDRAVFELGGRLGVGTPDFAISLGMGFRIMGPPARGKDVTTFVDPDVISTFMIDLSVQLRF